MRYHLLCLKVLPVSYGIKEVSDIPPADLRMAHAFSKATPYLLDPNSDEELVPQKLKERYITAVQRFRKENKRETTDFIKDTPFLRN